jgi:hypothetical protein
MPEFTACSVCLMGPAHQTGAHLSSLLCNSGYAVAPVAACLLVVLLFLAAQGLVQHADHSQAQYSMEWLTASTYRTHDPYLFSAPLTVQLPLLQATCTLLHAGLNRGGHQGYRPAASAAIRCGSAHHDGICILPISLCNSKCTLAAATCFCAACCMHGVCNKPALGTICGLHDRYNTSETSMPSYASIMSQTMQPGHLQLLAVVLPQPARGLCNNNQRQVQCKV